MPDSYYADLQQLYTKKRNHFLNGLRRLGLSFYEPQGAYFVLVDIDALLRHPRFAGMNDYALCEWMIENLGVAAVPGSSFFRTGGANYIRLHFARAPETLNEALKRLEGLAP